MFTGEVASTTKVVLRDGVTVIADGDRGVVKVRAPEGAEGYERYRSGRDAHGALRSADRRQGAGELELVPPTPKHRRRRAAEHQAARTRRPRRKVRPPRRRASKPRPGRGSRASFLQPSGPGCRASVRRRASERPCDRVRLVLARHEEEKLARVAEPRQRHRDPVDEGLVPRVGADDAPSVTSSVGKFGKSEATWPSGPSPSRTRSKVPTSESSSRYSAVPSSRPSSPVSGGRRLAAEPVEQRHLARR